MTCGRLDHPKKRSNALCNTEIKMTVGVTTAKAVTPVHTTRRLSAGVVCASVDRSAMPDQTSKDTNSIIPRKVTKPVNHLPAVNACAMFSLRPSAIPAAADASKTATAAFTQFSQVHCCQWAGSD